MAGINIDIAVNARQAQAGVKDLSGAIDDVGDSLDDLVRDSQRGTDAAARGFDKTADQVGDADRAVDRLTDSFSDLTRATAKQDAAQDRLKTTSGDTFKKAGESTGEFKQEALQNFSEVTSSFDGSMTSVVDLAQGTFGGLASLGGPVGLALGALGALIGATFAGLSTSADENSKEAAQSISDMYDDMVQSGEQFVSQDFVNQKIQEIVANQDKLNKVRTEAARAAVSEQTALRAEAGDRDALNAALAGAQEQYAGLKKRIDEVVMGGGKVSGELSGQASAAQDLILHYQALAANQDTATAKANLYASATSATAAAMANANGQVNGLNAQLSKLPKNVTVNVDAYTAAADAKLKALASRPLSIIVDARTRAGDRVF